MKLGFPKEKNATIRTKLFYKFGVMGVINDRSIVYNNVEICIANKCEIRVNKIDTIKRSEIVLSNWFRREGNKRATRRGI